jgi:hypothetical protein
MTKSFKKKIPVIKMIVETITIKIIDCKTVLFLSPNRPVQTYIEIRNWHLPHKLPRPIMICMRVMKPEATSALH